MTRTVIQIVHSVAPYPEIRTPYLPVSPNEQYLYALCDDGSIWSYNARTKDWDAVKAIPQPVEPENPF
jgi:hypothetical protein